MAFTLSSMEKFVNAFVKKRNAYPKISAEFIKDGKKYFAYGDKTTKGMDWLKVFDGQTGELVSWQNSLNGKTKIGRYDIFRGNGVVRHLSSDGQTQIKAVGLPQSSLYSSSLYDDMNSLARYKTQDYLSLLQNKADYYAGFSCIDGLGTNVSPWLL